MSCQNCNDGFIVICIDDLCRNGGECMHGDGEAACPVCHGDPDSVEDCDDEH